MRKGPGRENPAWAAYSMRFMRVIVVIGNFGTDWVVSAYSEARIAVSAAVPRYIRVFPMSGVLSHS
ncbi:hypothetical protein [Anaplasma capra]|uniref:hypothetical protein n=1 Tax=Anaplasma capra TaxID=1562740 RepID=UPI0021D5F1CB|nr:hypothetical protein [Anaplasma capra]MCU7611422.1 hypothetical protein [Anaplasma capra]MCU7612139.1 hypothetical protein [Anaplasma capra]